MFNKRTLTILKRELREKVMSRTFILMTVLIPIFLFGILALQTFFLSYKGDDNAKLEVVSESSQISQALKTEFDKEKFVTSGHYKISYSVMSKEEFDAYINKTKPDLLSSKLTGVIFIPSSALNDKKIEYYSVNPKNNTVFGNLRKDINKVLVDIHFADIKLSDEEIAFARTGVDFNGFRISKDESIKKEGIGNTIASFLFTFLLYFSLLFLGTMMMRSVVQEKASKIVEVLLSSVNSSELMTGKIIGTSVTGLLQMAIWLLPLIAVISSSWFVLPEEFTLSISLLQVGFFLLNYFIGIITFLGLFACVGAIFDNDQDAQSGIWPVMLLIMIPFFIAITLGNNPTSPIARIASMFPFASIIVMPARMTLADVPSWQFILSIVVSLLTMLGVFVVAGKIYRVGILMSGKKPKWSEVVTWLKYKY